MRGARPTPLGPALLALAVGCAALAGVLGHRSILAGAQLLSSLRGPGGWPAAEVADVVTVVATGAGALVAGWYALIALAALGARTRRSAGPAVAFLHRWGAPVLRHAALSGAAAGLGMTLAVSGAAATDGSTPLSTPPPDDLTWGTTWTDPRTSVPVGRPEPLL
ncbi:hypothetical protein PU560_03725, partial [Georgenia sp. 10Sc9-8]|nr:hypothetical protein [Georgenia halotolerans]